MVTDRHDVVVLGGGPAGLQAALTLGRMHRRVLLVDSAEYRNAPAAAMHNFVTHDGTAPADFRAAARDELRAYATVQVREARAVRVDSDDDEWRVALDGGDVVAARKVVLATGLRDTLPDTPGLADLWGDVVGHCPYCHGHELTGRHVALLGSHPRIGKVGLLLERIAAEVTVLTDGGELDTDTDKLLAGAGYAIRPEPVTGVQRNTAGDGATVSFATGPDLEVGGLFIATAMSQSAPFVADLHLEMLPSGCVRVDQLGRTSRPGIYAAGDMAHQVTFPMPMASVLTAAAAGLLAATAVDQDLLGDDHGLPTPV